jgi:hypothetical protein
MVDEILDHSTKLSQCEVKTFSFLSHIELNKKN